MKTLRSIIAILLAATIPLRAADIQIKDLTGVSSAAATSILRLQINDAGTFRDRKITIDDLFTGRAISLGSGESLVGAETSGVQGIKSLVAGTNVTLSTSANSITINASGGGGGSISDGDKGSITVSGSGATWTLDDAAVTMAKLAQAGATSGQVIKWSGSAWAPAADATGGGGSSALHGKGLFVDKDRSDGTGTDYDPNDPFPTIAAAVASWVAGDAIIVRGASTAYNESVALNGGMTLYFEAGANTNYTGSGATFVTSGGSPGQVKILGQGRHYKSGTAATQYVFNITGSDLWHVDVMAEDARTTIGTTTADGLGMLTASGVTFTSGTRASTAPASIGLKGYQTDDQTHWISTGTSPGNWTALNAATVHITQGYFSYTGHSLDGMNAPAIRWNGGGNIDVRAARIRGSGPGLRTIDVGKATEWTAFRWANITTKVIQSDADERVVGTHGSTHAEIYLYADQFNGNYEDAAAGGDSDHLFVFFPRVGRWTTNYEDAVLAATTRPMFSCTNTGGLVFGDILFMQGQNAKAVHWAGFAGYSYLRIGTLWNIGTATEPTITCAAGLLFLQINFALGPSTTDGFCFITGGHLIVQNGRWSMGPNGPADPVGILVGTAGTLSLENMHLEGGSASIAGDGTINAINSSADSPVDPGSTILHPATAL